jgi:hypothetical protein
MSSGCISCLSSGFHRCKGWHSSACASCSGPSVRAATCRRRRRLNAPENQELAFDWNSNNCHGVKRGRPSNGPRTIGLLRWGTRPSRFKMALRRARWSSNGREGHPGGLRSGRTRARRSMPGSSIVGQRIGEDLRQGPRCAATETTERDIKGRVPWLVQGVVLPHEAPTCPIRPGRRWPGSR